MPRFAYEYLTGGCFTEINLERNTKEIRDIQLMPWYLNDYIGSDLKTELFGKTTTRPSAWRRLIARIDVAEGNRDIGPCRPQTQRPFILSTVGTASIETVAELTDCNAWFQLYHPTDDELRDKLIDRGPPPDCQLWSSWPIPRLLAGDRRRSATAFPSPPK